jgi:GNAT superfamily N-acetyltransferase
LNVGVELRDAGPDDVETCFTIQKRSALVGYAHIFDQSLYPFPDDVVRAEWQARLASEADVLLAVRDGEPVGTATARGAGLEGLFVVPEQWGHGVAGRLHDAVIAVIAARSEHAELDVMEENARARAFYRRRGWTATGERDGSPFPPYPVILRYRLDLSS